MSETILYGIKQCDTVRKARRWLDEQGIAYRFHDFRSDGLGSNRVESWLADLGPALINRRSTAWRNLDPATREGLSTDRAAALIAETPTLIKRPLLEAAGKRLVGFDPAEYRALLL